MFNRIQAKEKAKTILRQRTFLDAFGYSWILAAVIGCTALPLLLAVLSAAGSSAVLTLSSIGGIVGIPFSLSIPTPLVVLYMLIGLIWLGVAVCVSLLFHAGMVRASLRLNRRDSKVRVLDVVLAGDRLSIYIRIVLWKLLFLIVWNLPSVVAILLAVLLSTTLTSVGVVLGIILTIAAWIWSVYITINKICQYFFSFHVAEDNRKMDALECLRESGNLIVSHKFELFVTILSFWGWNILSVPLLTNIFIVPYQYMTYAAIYEQLIGKFQTIPRGEMPWWTSGKDRQAPENMSPLQGHIKIISGDFEGSVFPLPNSEELKIGRDPQRASIVAGPNSKEISGLHCGIRFDQVAGNFLVTDYSSNGTYVDEKPIPFGTSVHVARDTVIRLADGAMVLRLY